MKFAVIPTNGRPCLEQCLEAISPQVDLVVLVATGNELLPDFVLNYDNVGQGHRFYDSLNISAWWNKGLDHAEASAVRYGRPTWDVAVLNDDVIVPEGWFDAVATGMRQNDCAAACSGGVGSQGWVWREPKAVPLQTRMQGFAFILAGERGLRANENLRWYFTDDYIDWESRKLGGMVMINGYPVQHLYPNGQVTSEIMEQIAKDAQTFVDIYGMRPW
jgi:hypothetical protein